MTEHNQGIWRVVYDPKKLGVAAPVLVKSKTISALDELLSLPQPGSEWSRLEAERLMAKLGPQPREQVTAFARIANSPLEHRLAAIRLLAGQFGKFDLTKTLGNDEKPEIRAQSAWLAGLRGGDDLEVVRKLLKDPDAFVRRRALEALTRHASTRYLPELARALADRDRTVRYAAMIVLSHLPTSDWISRFENSSNPQVALRTLTAASLRGEKPNIASVRKITMRLTDLTSPKVTTREDMLDLLRVLALYEPELKRAGSDEELRFVRAIASGDAEISWERARLLANFEDAAAVPSLVKALYGTKDPVRQFHFFQCLAKIPAGWTHENEERVMDWALTTQQGWFAEFNNKGVEFPLFLQSALEEFASHHQEAVMASANRIQFESLLGSALLGLIAEREPARLFKLYEAQAAEPRRIKMLEAMGRVRTPETAAFLRRELGSAPSASLRKAAIGSLKAMPASPENDVFLKEPVAANKPERPDPEIYNTILLTSIESGDAMRGRKIYERYLCNSCHAGGQTPGQEGRLFGPDLTGVTSRLTRAELADAMVYPSKQVADRFKAVGLTLKDGRELTGFVTERTADHVTFADATTVYRLRPNEIEKQAPQEKSLMPEGLLRALSDQEIAHLLKFLSTIGTAAK
jgi:putative heme-binding domain-containing protein